MFDYCSIKKDNCAYASKRKNVTYCGLHTGTAVENQIENIKICPLTTIKNKRK